jgi:hypothetical protein
LALSPRMRHTAPTTDVFVRLEFYFRDLTRHPEFEEERPSMKILFYVASIGKSRF